MKRFKTNKVCWNIFGEMDYLFGLPHKLVNAAYYSELAGESRTY